MKDKLSAWAGSRYQCFKFATPPISGTDKARLFKFRMYVEQTCRVSQFLNLWPLPISGQQKTVSLERVWLWSCYPLKGHRSSSWKCHCTWTDLLQEMTKTSSSCLYHLATFGLKVKVKDAKCQNHFTVVIKPIGPIYFKYGLITFLQSTSNGCCKTPLKWF